MKNLSEKSGKIVKHFWRNNIYISERRNMKEGFERWKRRIETGFTDNKSAFYKEVV